MEKSTAQIFKEMKICVVIPTYNNAKFLRAVLDSVLSEVEDLIVVNDSSPDETEEILLSYNQRITYLKHSKNCGKGKALITGFKKAKKLGFDYAVTMDSDSQHKASDLRSFALEISSHPGALIVGERDLEGKLSQASGFANKFSNFWFTVHTLKKLKDTQTGYRLYPMKPIADFKIFSSKYETELEMLVRAAWRGVEIRGIKIDVYYPPSGERVSSFRPGRDFMRISVLNTIFTFAAFLYGYPSMLIHFLIRKFKKQC